MLLKTIYIDILLPADPRTRHHHSFKFKQIQSHTTQYKHSFFVRTVPEWNSLREACVDADTITAFQKQLHYAPWAVCTPPIVVIRESGLTIIVLELLELEINTVAMETVQLVLSQFKNFLAQWIQNWIRSLSAKNYQNSLRRKKLHWPRLIWPTLFF